MTTQTETQERAERVIKFANRYDFTALMDALFWTSDPDSMRRDLMKCYFYITDREIDPNKEMGEMYYRLYSLQLLIEALDLTPETPGPLRIVNKEVDKFTADNLEQLDREREISEAEMWREIYRDLYRISYNLLSPETQQYHQEMKKRIERATKCGAIMPENYPVY